MACRREAVSVQTYQRWRAQYREMRPEPRGGAVVWLRDRFPILQAMGLPLDEPASLLAALLPEEAFHENGCNCSPTVILADGYRRIHALQREGWLCNRKRVQRLRRDEGRRRAREGTAAPAWAANAGHLVAALPD